MITKRMRIYISGPITGTQDAGPRFRETEAILNDAYPEAEVINPVHVANGLPILEHDEYMRISFACMDVCTHMYQMPGWRESRGCNQEAGYAFAKRIPIIAPLTIEKEVRDEEGF